MVKKISFFSLRNIRNAVRILAVSQGGNFLYILQHGCKFSSWLMVNSYFDQLLLATNLHPCRKIRATECVQRTIALYQYKLLNLFPFSVIEFCEVVVFKPWTQYLWSKSGTLFFFFHATCATSFRIMAPCFTMWVNKYSAKDFVDLLFARS